jgi:hypothetical protein
MHAICSSLAPLVLGAVLLFPLHVHADESGLGPAAVTEKVYRSAFDHFADLQEKSIARQKSWLTPGLYARIEKELNKPVPPGDAPEIEGDLFLDCQDAPTALKVGDASITGNDARVKVMLAWDDEKRTYTVLLKKLPDGWKIDDVLFGKDGSLSAMLK